MQLCESATPQVICEFLLVDVVMLSLAATEEEYSWAQLVTCASGFAIRRIDKIICISQDTYNSKISHGKARILP
jgi:hypothetical protein